MGRVVRVRSGHWEKSEEGIWRFEVYRQDMEQFILARANEEIESVCHLVREELCIAPTTPMLLTYKLPPCMIDPEGSQSQPTNVETSFDVEVMMSVDEWTNGVQLWVTHGALEVAKYQFLCRSPFTIGSRTFLSEGTTEEEHLEIINGVIRHDEIHCSEDVLKEVFSEDKMVLLYHFSFEVEKAKTTNILKARPLLFNDRNVSCVFK